jgi:hypothetical protein
MKNNLIKAPYQKTEFKTDKELEDFIKCCDPVTGYQYFMNNFFYIQHATKGSMLYQPYPYQRKLIDIYHNYRNSISLMSRQSGKTTSAAGYLLWYGMFIPDSSILIAAHKFSGSQEIMQRVRYAYENCPDHIRCGVITYNKGSLEFENGSRIVSTTTTENTGRGMSISLLYMDEFAFVRPTIAELFWTSITPTLATGGKCIITSTPNSDEDQFALIWKGANKNHDSYGNETELGINGFKPYKVTWEEVPERDEKWKNEMVEKLGIDRFRREMNCEFIVADETLINPSTLIELEGTDPILKMGQVRWYDVPKKGDIYTVSLDPSLGTGGDYAAIQIFNASTQKQIGEWRHNKTAIPEQIKIIAQICDHIYSITNEEFNIYYSCENNSIGEAALLSFKEYGEHNIKGIFISEPGAKRKGFATTQRPKLAACAKLKNLIETKKMNIKSKSLISELKTYIAHGGSYAAKIGETDDLVSSLLIQIRMMQHLSSFNMDLDLKFRDHNEIIQPLPFFAII